MNAMLASVEHGIAIDPRRMYLAGFSGTARQIWEFALELRGGVAGVIRFGAGIARPSDALGASLGGEHGVSYFGGAGDEDFNYFETRALAAQLRRMHVAARVADYRAPRAPARVAGVLRAARPSRDVRIDLRCGGA